MSTSGSLRSCITSCCYEHSRYEVWQDMVVMIACAIANAVDKRHFDEREAMYMRVVQKYTKDELAIFPEFFSHPYCPGHGGTSRL